MAAVLCGTQQEGGVLERNEVITASFTRLYCMFSDLRYALRTLRSAPAFGITVVLTLGIGLGLNTMLFTLFNAYVLHPFAVRDPHTLYQLSWATARNEQSAVSWEQYQDIHQSPIFSGAFAFSPFLARVESRNLQGMS